MSYNDQWSSDNDYLTGITNERTLYRIYYHNNNFNGMHKSLRNIFNEIFHDVPTHTEARITNKDSIVGRNYEHIFKLLSEYNVKMMRYPLKKGYFYEQFYHNVSDLIGSNELKDYKKSRMSLMLSVDGVLRWYDSVETKYQGCQMDSKMVRLILHKFDVAYRILLNELSMQRKLYKLIDKSGLISQISGV